MRKSLFLIIFLTPISHHLLLDLGAEAAPAGPLIKHLSSLIKWTRSSPKKTPQVDGNVVEFENGYVVETIVEGNKLGVEPHSIRVCQYGELLAVDSINSNVVRVTPPLSQTYCVVADESVGRQVPMAFLDRIKDDFVLRFGSGKATTAVANSLNKEFGPKLKEHMQYCVDDPEKISKLAKVKAQFSEVIGVMMENIEKTIQKLKERVLSIIGLHES